MKYQFRTKPFAHQRKGLIRLWKRKGGALFWEPGTGKTKTALDYAAALLFSGKVKRVLILCPINAMQVWPQQMKLHLPNAASPFVTVPDGSIADKANYISRLATILDVNQDRLHFLILNYDAVTKRDKKWEIMKALEEYDPDLLILDESQKVKNATAKRSKAAHRLGGNAKYVVLLSGTPVSKNYLDLYSQLKVIDPHIWEEEGRDRDMSWTRFRHRYGIWGGESGYELRGYQGIDDLRRRYLPYVSTARKRYCLDLPGVTDVVIPVEMNAASRLAYDAFLEEGLVVWRARLIDAPIVLTKLLRAQEMTGGAVHDETGEVIEFQKDKMATFKGLIEDLKEGNEKVLVFARFIWEMDTIIEVTKSKFVIRGGVSHKRRKQIIRDFIESDKPDVLLIQIAAGEALDGLQHVCSNAIFYSTDFSWDHYVQARGRLDRQGQETPVTFWHLHMIGTVDKLVYRALKKKETLEKMVMDDPDLLIVDKSDSVY